ncbi:anti-anti-sigma factor [Nostoc sp. CENA543]|uniref:STAS domain-containing protein n=1 Tax=Nostoc sp. CENA543 TaxID=1869241 RepID=UPI000CA16E92|nr:STAS domain-containing protein [Nostoc sp. CENA543]AUT01471.1 anti-anti-sigma factor [Nostoc sp. CENA543]
MNHKEKVKVIQPRGIFDGRRGRKVYQEVMDSIDKHIETVLVDCQDIQFMDSSGFGTLLLTLKTVRQKKGRLVLCSLNEQIRMILELSDTANIFEVFPDHSSFIATVPQQ